MSLLSLEGVPSATYWHKRAEIAEEALRRIAQGEQPAGEIARAARWTLVDLTDEEREAFWREIGAAA